MSGEESAQGTETLSANGRPLTRGTVYNGPVERFQLRIADLRLRLVRPADPDRMLDDPDVQAWNRHDDYMPYWAYLWPGALLLAHAVACESWTVHPGEGEPLRALEIGCGIGLAGLVALGRGLHVCFSDYDPAALGFASSNAEENGFDHSRFSTRLLDWRRPPEETFSVVLGSDVLYERRLVPLIADLLAKLLADDGMALIACPGRSSAEGFAAAVQARGMHCQVRSECVLSE